MENPIIMSDRSEEEAKTWWENKKQELLENIHATIKEGKVEPEVLEIMKELVENAKVRSNMSNYYGEMEDKEEL